MTLLTLMGDVTPAFSFTQDTASLAAAWRSDSGVTKSGSNITSIAGAYGTSPALTGVASFQPTLSAALGPASQDLIALASASTQRFTVPTLTLTACTFIFVLSPENFTANQTLLGGTANVLQIQLSGASSTQGLSARPVGAASPTVFLTPTGSNLQSHKLQVLVVTYDPSLNGGTCTAWLNGVAGTPVGAMGAGGFSFTTFGSTSGATNPYGGFLGPTLIYNRVLTGYEIGVRTQALAAWMATKIYVAAAGSDTSSSPWSQTTPLQTLAGAFAYPFNKNETIALKGGDVFRMATQQALPFDGLSNTQRMELDGGLWGTGKAQVRGSTAPTLTVSSGTIYSAGAIAFTPVAFVYYIPGGTITWGDAFYALGNMQRLTQDLSTPGAPAVGKWGISGGTLFVNAGVALTTGDIELPVALLGSPIFVGKNNWNVRNITVAFCEQRGWTQNGKTNHEFDHLDAFFCEQDGMDGQKDAGGNSPVNWRIQYCIVGWNGIGPASLAAAAGDGFSHHDATQAVHFKCQAWWNDKAGFDHQSTTFTTHDSCIAVGSSPYSLLDSVGGGSASIVNSIAVVPVGAITPSGIANYSTNGVVLTAENNTIYSRSAGAAGNGLWAQNAGAAVVSRNNIIDGFLIGINRAAGSTGWDEDYDCLFGNGTASNTTLGAHAVTGDPKLNSQAAYDFTLQAGSSCSNAGVAIAGITKDYSGTTRGNPPEIGALEAA